MIHDDRSMFPIPEMDHKLRGPEEGPKYHVRIIRRDGMGQTRDDFHATVTRLSDDVQLVFISDWRTWLEWRTRRSALDRAFRSYDKHEAKILEVREVTK